jgi:glycosyltransferase involved in cell wall biosynthesis
LVHATAYVNVAYSEVYFAPLLDAASLDTPIVTGHNLADFAQISPHEYHTCSQIDPESIAQAIIDAYTNPKRLSAASQEALRNRHAPDIVARQLLEMYQELG